MITDPNRPLIGEVIPKSCGACGFPESASLYLNSEFPCVCRVCFDMGSLIRDSKHWSDLDARERAFYERLRKNS